jgi:hypothetical protein
VNLQKHFLILELSTKDFMLGVFSNWPAGQERIGWQRVWRGWFHDLKYGVFGNGSVKKQIL